MKLGPVLHAIDFINESAGKIVSLLFLPMVLITATEVVLRYFFRKPTIWAWDVNIQLMALIAILGAGYTLLHEGHVITDVFVERVSKRTRAILDLATSTFFFLAMGTLFWLALGEAVESVAAREHYTSLWSPPLYPLRVFVAVGVFLLLIQGVAKFIRDLGLATAKRES